MEDYAKLSLGVSCLCILITSLAFYIFIRLLLGKLKKKKEEKWNTFLVYYIFLIILMLVLILANLLTEYEMVKESTLGKIVDEASAVLRNSRNKLDDVSLDGLSKQHTDKWFDEQFKFDELKESTYAVIAFEKTEKIVNDYLSFAREQLAFSKELVEFVKWRANLTDIASCKLECDRATNGLFKNMTDVVDVYEVELGVPPVMELRIGYIVDELKNDVSRMKLNELGTTILENDLIDRKAMIMAFQASINNTESIREDWIERIVDFLPDRQSILKSLILGSSLMHMLLSIVILVLLILSITKRVPQKIVSTVVTIVVVLTAILTLALSGYTIVLCFQFQVKCPLVNDTNFGLLNFTSLVQQEDDISLQLSNLSSTLQSNEICQHRDEKFFEEWWNYSDMHKYFLRFDSDTWATRNKAVEKTTPIPFQYTYKQTRQHRGAVQRDYETIADSCIEAEANQCPQSIMSVKLYPRIKKMQKRYRRKMVKMENLFDEYNAYQSGEFIERLMAIFKKPYDAVITSYNEAVNQIKRQFDSAQIECKVLFDIYSNIGNSICSSVDVEITLLWVYLIVVLLAFTASVFLHVFVLRNLKNVTKTNESKEQQTTTPPTQTTQTQSV